MSVVGADGDRIIFCLLLLLDENKYRLLQLLQQAFKSREEENGRRIKAVEAKYVARNHARRQGAMSKELIEFAYEELCRLDSCNSRSQFSTDWLGVNPAYFRSVSARSETISVQAQAYLVATLRSVGMCFAKSKFPPVQDKGATMLSLSNMVLDDLFERVTMNAVSYE